MNNYGDKLKIINQHRKFIYELGYCLENNE